MSALLSTLHPAPLRAPRDLSAPTSAAEQEASSVGAPVVVAVRPQIPTAGIALFVGLALAQLLALVALVVLTPWPAGLPGLCVGLGALLSAAALLPVLAVRLRVPALRRIPDGEAPTTGWPGIAYGAYRLLQMFFLAPWLHGQVLPAPLRTAYARACGARIGAGSTCAGIICDPPFTRIGTGSLIGLNAVLTAHAIGPGHDRIQRIDIGDGCLVGGGAIILAGGQLGPGAVVAAGTVLPAGRQVPAGATWARISARLS
jgi:hypothetical protein